MKKNIEQEKAIAQLEGPVILKWKDDHAAAEDQPHA